MRLLDTLKDGDLIEAKSFRKLFPKEVYELLVTISREGFSLTLVGGAVRDWLLTSELPHDLDFELRHTFDYDESDWIFRLNRLGERLREIYHYDVEFLSFSIMRISWSGLPFDVELGPARVEVYDTQSEGHGHSDFKALLKSNASYEETFKRRDFTLNALGVELRSPNTDDEFVFVDPFKGREDLNKMLLRPCGENFSKDPVRFCRALRFANKYSLSYSESLVKCFGKFNLSHLSHFYFFREGLKGNFFKFSHDFFSLCEEYSIPYNDELKKIAFLKGNKLQSLHLRNEEEVLLALLYKGEASVKELEDFSEVATIKKGLVSSHLIFRDTVNELSHLNLTPVSSAQDFCKDPLSALLLTFHQFLSKTSRDTFSLIGRLNPDFYKVYLDWGKIVPANLEGKELFEQLQESVPPAHRGKLLIYCHLKETKQIECS
ncbi:MAG: hypothetical protein VXV96_10140 [Bdellovibrionota bacterium]|nr:hypothetical protein [Bdellovibrionota bacterium]